MKSDRVSTASIVASSRVAYRMAPIALYRDHAGEGLGYPAAASWLPQRSGSVYQRVPSLLSIGRARLLTVTGWVGSEQPGSFRASLLATTSGAFALTVSRVAVAASSPMPFPTRLLVLLLAPTITLVSAFRNLSECAICDGTSSYGTVIIEIHPDGAC